MGTSTSGIDLTGAPLAFRAAARAMTASWAAGSLVLDLPDGRQLSLVGAEAGPAGRLCIRDFSFIQRVLRTGTVGFAEGYVAGEWDAPDLAATLEVLALNLSRFERLSFGSRIGAAVNLVGHALRGNSRRGSKRNIHAHYDLGNSFYARWLDPSMTYSAARFEKPDEPLSLAQRRKYQTLAQMVDLREGQHVLEIGCGWGGFAETAARDFGAKVTGITISKEQHDYARRRIFEGGLAERVDIRLVDYRDVEGQFDRVASIEMFEAVGERYWPVFFDKVREVLKPGGRAGLQVITIQDEFFDHYRRTPDFIQKYIFPGGMLPSEPRLREAIGKAGLTWGQISRFGEHYAETLSRWTDRFDAAWSDIRALGFDERFRKLWRFYLSYCEAGFRAKRTDVVQLALSRV